MSTTEKPPKPVGVILAGGRSSRMGEEKTLMDLAGISLMQRSIDRLKGGVSTLVLSANGDPLRFERHNLPVVGDTIPGHMGPLAGVLAGMIWAMEHKARTSHILTIAADTPFFPTDLVEVLVSALASKENTIAIPQTGSRLHPAFGLWPLTLTLTKALEDYLRAGERRVHGFLEGQNYVPVEFPMLELGGEQLDPFFNINDRDDHERARRWLEIQPV